MKKTVIGSASVLVLWTVLGASLLSMTSSWSIIKADVDYDEMCFAEECIPYEGDNFYNKERIDRELAITMLNEAQVAMYHRREKQFIPYIIKELRANRLPDDLVYLAMAESALRNRAVSTAWAAGIWQFMPGTARDYGLRVDDEIDERYHFEKATKAAIQYLKKLYSQFGDWSLAAAAYNRGENGLRGDLDRQYVQGYYDAWLNDETARYVFRIIAIKYIMENRYDFYSVGFLGKQYDNPEYEEVQVRWPITDLASWALEEYETTYRAIKELNPWIVGSSLPAGDWTIKLFEKE